MRVEIKPLLVQLPQTIGQAIKTIDEKEKGIVLIVDSQNRLLGTLTDGDVRRGFIEGLTVDDPVEKVMNKSPITAHVGTADDQILELMAEKEIRHLPLLDKNNCVVDLEFQSPRNIPHCIPYIKGNEREYLEQCIETGWVSQVGPFVDRFERDFASYHGVSQAAAVSSGTAAIHLGLIALGVKEGDYVLCPTFTFVGSINPVKYCHASPILLDIEEQTFNLDPENLKFFLCNETKRRNGVLTYKKDGRRISALIVVHLYGNPARMDEIMKIAHEYHLPVLEDAAESLGAKYKGKLVGTIGDVGCFSFNGNKVITAGGGGMIISRDEEKTKLCKHLSVQAKATSFEFRHDHIGFNYRLSNLCAAVGTAQLENLDEFIETKRKHARLYKTLLKDYPEWEFVDEPEGAFGTFWAVVLRFKGGVDGKFLDEMYNLSKKGIDVRPTWIPAHQMDLYKGEERYCSERAKDVYESTVCLPCSVGITEEEIRRVVGELAKIVKEKAKR